MENGGDGYYGGAMYIPIPIPIPNWKSRRFPIPIPSQCGDSPSTQGRVRTIPTGTGLFAISRSKMKVEKGQSQLVFGRVDPSRNSTDSTPIDFGRVGFCQNSVAFDWVDPSRNSAEFSWVNHSQNFGVLSRVGLS